MAATAPVAIGTRGTVGSLVRKEIEYFSRQKLEMERRQGKIVDMASSRGNSKTSFWFLITTWRRKKRRTSSGTFLPNICSAVEVAENRIPGFSYRILKEDVKNLYL